MSRRPPLLSIVVTAAASLLGAHCTGAISDPGDGRPSEPGGTASTQAPLPGEAPLRRLTARQYANAVHEVFGDSITVPADLEPDESTEIFASVGASKVSTSPHGVEQYQAAALDIAQQVLEQRASYPLLADCAPASASDPCVKPALRHFGRRLFRRTLAEAEVSRYAKVVGAAGDDPEAVALGLRYALAALLASPSFLYLPVSGEPEPGKKWPRLGGTELASRLALFLWDSIPDEALLDAAEQGELASAAGVRKEAERMLDDPRALGLAGRFFAEQWNVARLSADDKNPEVFPDWSPTLLEGMKNELQQTLADAVASDENLLDVLFGGQSFVNGDLAAFYGIDGVDGSEMQKVSLPPTRAGLLTSGAVIAANSPSDRTSPTHRGVFVLERILCQHVPAPPANVNDSLVTSENQDEPTTLKEKLAKHREDPVCASCHDVIDPAGFTFESFDGIGRHRTTDNGQPVDTTGVLEGHALEDVHDLAAFLRADPRVPSCIAQQVLAFAVGHELGPRELPYAELANQAFVQKGSFETLVLEIVTSDAFRYFVKETP